MFIAHLPAGYLLVKALQHKIVKADLNRRIALPIMLIGAVFPDLDLFYFYLIDGRSVHHHQYFMHWPLFWLGLLLVAFVGAKITARFKHLFNYAMLFLSAVLLHISLDTFVGDIWLLAPFIFEPFVFFEVTPRYQPWWLNFIIHWSFAVELLICAIAYYCLRRSRQTIKLELS